MVRRARGMSSAKWQSNGYFPADEMTRPSRIGRGIVFAKRLSLLLGQWLIDMLMAGSILLAFVLFVAAALYIASLVGVYHIV